MSFHDILAWIGVGFAALVIGDFVTQYASSTATGFARFLAAGRGSATILWQQFGFAIAGIVLGFDKIVDVVTGIAGDSNADASIKSAIAQWFTPTTVSLVLAGYAAITVIARVRTLSRTK